MPGLRGYPTPWQRRMLWTTLTAIALAALVALVLYVIWLASELIAFLQPLLMPFAIAGVLAFLLEPLVRKMCSRGVPRLWAVIILFAGFLLISGGVVAWMVPVVKEQVQGLVQRFPTYKLRLTRLSQKAMDFYTRNLAPTPALPGSEPASPGATPGATPDPKARDTKSNAIKEFVEDQIASLEKQLPAGEAGVPDGSEADVLRQLIQEQIAILKKQIPEEEVRVDPVMRFVQEQIPKLEEQIPGLVNRLGAFIWRSVAGSLGIIGFLLGLVIVPVYLFLLLLDGPSIKQRWSDYLPLRASALKTELVSVLMEINGYLIAFFRGQLLVSVIDGVLTGIALVCIGLDFGLMIGILLAILGVIPYLGIVICWIPAVLIAFAQSGGDWHYPMWVTLVFIVIQQLDGIFIAPKIVGESVGLHPLTVIMSVFGWSLLLGGLLGAILAVPLTATLKVLLRRYIWDKGPAMDGPPPPDASLEPPPPGDPPAEGSVVTP